jgi:mannosyl-oligosaccharide glucosidase
MATIGRTLQIEVTSFENTAEKIKEMFNNNFIDNHTNLPKDYAFVKNAKVYSPHFGYPSILPLAMGLLTHNSASFNATLDKIKSDLDAGYGLTSISRYDKLYLGDESAYWRGPVWMNINYLFLRALQLYYPS